MKHQKLINDDQWEKMSAFPRVFSHDHAVRFARVMGDNLNSYT